jgi:dTDP-4-dehydrorhamnose reductase
MSPLQLWAGPECTVNRVGDQYRDQLVSSGFDRRPGDLDRLAGIGAKRLRFPLLWERTCPGPGRFEWDWSDVRIQRLRELDLPPIAGLLHHGSGPRHTSLLDPAFPDLLADYARAVAERYPDIGAYTPVNEPVTTARFSALYGLWYPHKRDDRSFVRALLNQVRGTVLAMRAVRQVNPRAQLVQTDDLGHVDSSPRLRYQAEFENLRRWLSFDLLTGRVDAQHPMRSYLRRYGASEQELQALVDQPCPPDIVGINSYVTSERFLDERVSLYPPEMHGGNGRDAYVDIELARVHGRSIGGFAARLREASERYRLPVAITEVHLGCSRDEQLRWLHQAWRAAQDLRHEGHDVRAVTVWAAFGTCDWDSLVTRDAGHYEPGLWDVSSGEPRPTALAALAGQLGRGDAPDNPVLDGPGWWQRELRLHYPTHGELETLPVAGRPLLITGASGTLGRAFARFCELRGLPHQLLSRADMDIADAASVAAALERWQPWAVVNTAGFVRVDDAERDPRQWRDNLVGPGMLAQECAQRGIRLMSFSSDLVFDGSKDTPYVESDSPAPLNAYGRAKFEAERLILDHAPNALLIRTSAFFGPWDPHNFVAQALEHLRRGEHWAAAEDQCISPTYVPDLAQAALDLLVDGESGLWHLSNQGEVSWYRFAQMAAEAAKVDARLIRGLPTSALGQLARRPGYSVLTSERALLMPSLEHALSRYVMDCERYAGEWPLRNAAQERAVA